MPYLGVDSCLLGQCMECRDTQRMGTLAMATNSSDTLGKYLARVYVTRGTHTHTQIVTDSELALFQGRRVS